MAVTYSVTNTKNNRLKMVFLAGAVTPAAGESVDAGASFGTIVIGTSSLSGATGVLATITLPKPSFSIASGVATLLGVPLSNNASASGTAAKAEIRDSAGNVIVSGLTVGTSGTDIVLNTTTITSGVPVSITSGTVTHA
jgi:hypothetical protein